MAFHSLLLDDLYEPLLRKEGETRSFRSYNKTMAEARFGSSRVVVKHHVTGWNERSSDPSFFRFVDPYLWGKNLSCFLLTLLLGYFCSQQTDSKKGVTFGSTKFFFSMPSRLFVSMVLIRMSHCSCQGFFTLNVAFSTSAIHPTLRRCTSHRGYQLLAWVYADPAQMYLAIFPKKKKPAKTFLDGSRVGWIEGWINEQTKQHVVMVEFFPARNWWSSWAVAWGVGALTRFVGAIFLQVIDGAHFSAWWHWVWNNLEKFHFFMEDRWNFEATSSDIFGQFGCETCGDWWPTFPETKPASYPPETGWQRLEDYIRFLLGFLAYFQGRTCCSIYTWIFGSICKISAKIGSSFRWRSRYIYIYTPGNSAKTYPFLGWWVYGESWPPTFGDESFGHVAWSSPGTRGSCFFFARRCF